MHTNTLPDTTIQKMLHELRTIMAGSQQWVKVHSAEYLVWLGYHKEVKKEFLQEEKKYSALPNYRIGVWRVLAQSETVPGKKKQWTDRILEAFGATDTTERLHAVETLAKLNLSPIQIYPEQTRKALLSSQEHLDLFTLWATSFSSDSTLQKNREKFLEFVVSHSDQTVRKISSYVLRKLGGLSPEQQLYLGERALAEPSGSTLKYSVLHTAFILLEDSRLRHSIREEMMNGYEHFSADQRIELALALADNGSLEDVPVLISFVDKNNHHQLYDINSNEGAEVRAAAAFAVLKIKSR